MVWYRDAWVDFVELGLGLGRGRCCCGSTLVLSCYLGILELGILELTRTLLGLLVR
jgi:hypothetical protein